MDAQNGRIQILDLKEGTWKYIKYPDVITQSFDTCPMNLDVDSKGNIYVSDNCHDKIMMWTHP